MAREGGFSKAARVLCIAQPAVTRMVKTLELEVGRHLFERDAKGVRLTQVGAALMRHCQIIFEEIERAGELFSAPTVDSRVTGRLLVGTGDALASHLFPTLLSRLSKQHPGVRPWVLSGSADELCQRLLTADIELAWSFHLPKLPEGLEVRRQYPVRHQAVVAATHLESSVARTSFIGSREVDDVAVQGYPTLERIQKDWPEARIAFSSNAMLLHRELVLKGLGTAVLPEFIVAADLEAGRLVALYPDESFIWPLNVVSRRGESWSAAALAHLELADELVAAWAPRSKKAASSL